MLRWLRGWLAECGGWLACQCLVFVSSFTVQDGQIAANGSPARWVMEMLWRDIKRRHVR